MPHCPHRTEVLLFLLLFLAPAFFRQPMEYDNTLSRYLLLCSIVDRGTLNIDAYQQYTIDKSDWQGHYYSNKAPGASLLAVPVFWVLRHLAPSAGGPPLTMFEAYVVRVVTTGIPFALLGVVMFRLALFCGADARRALAMVLAYAFGSIALIHAGLFSGHDMAGSFAFFAFAILVRVSGFKASGEGFPSPAFFGAGLLAGLAALTDFTAMLIAAFLAVYALSLRAPLRAKLSFLGGGAVCAALLAAYNQACFGHAFSLSYAHLSEGEFANGAAQGFFGVAMPRPGILVKVLASPERGLLFVMPVLLLSLAGFAAFWAKREWRREAMLMGAVVVGYILFNAGLYCWHGGWTVGPRYLVPMLPFMAFFIAFGNWSRLSYLVAFILSVFQVAFAVIGHPHVPEQIANPLVEVILPCMAAGYMADNAGMLLHLRGAWSLLPLALVLGALAVALYRCVRTAPSIPAAPGKALLLFDGAVLVWCAAILVMLATVRTDPESMVHLARQHLLHDAAMMKQSPQLEQAATREGQQAGIR
jgi:hypothetical protein